MKTETFDAVPFKDPGEIVEYLGCLMNVNRTLGGGEVTVESPVLGDKKYPLVGVRENAAKRVIVLTVGQPPHMECMLGPGHVREIELDCTSPPAFRKLRRGVHGRDTETQRVWVSARYPIDMSAPRLAEIEERKAKEARAEQLRLQRKAERIKRQEEQNARTASWLLLSERERQENLAEARSQKTKGQAWAALPEPERERLRRLIRQDTARSRGNTAIELSGKSEAAAYWKAKGLDEKAIRRRLQVSAEGLGRLLLYKEDDRRQESTMLQPLRDWLTFISKSAGQDEQREEDGPSYPTAI